MRKLALVLMVAVALGAAAPVLAQVPAVQEVLFAYLVNIPQDFNSIAAPALKTRLDAGEKPFILDVREPNEYAAGYIAGAANVPIRTLGQNLGQLPSKSTPIVVICKSGMRGAYVTMTLSILGWQNVKDLAFGMSEWEKQNFPLQKP